MKKFYTTIVALLATVSLFAQGWPKDYNGVMLQGFYWDSYYDTKWTNLEAQADELAPYFDLVWIPQSAYCGNKSMGYDDLYWFTDYNSSFGNERELRSMISAFKTKGIGTIADVVINHRKNVSTWFDFPVETYKGVTYEMFSTDICANDDNGKTAAEAKKKGVALSSSNDTGEDWNTMRDLDHNSANVQKVVKAYLDMLLNDFGYTGFRYDMVKGYGAKFTGIYNTAAKPAFSVGEYWDGDAATVKRWMDGTKVNGTITSGAFDFPVRYAVRDAIKVGWNGNVATGVIGDSQYRQYAISFVENHDTQFRSAENQQDPIRKDTLAANAFIMAACGTPCVFLPHWMAYKHDIKMMINARKMAGITNTSNTVFNIYKGTNYNALLTTGSKASLLAVMGEGANKFNAPATHAEIIAGYHYRYFLSKSANTAWVDLPDGTYTGQQQARLTAVTNTEGAQLVYTTDGSTPTVQSKKATSGTCIDIAEGTTTLKVGLLTDGAVSGIISRTYTVKKDTPFEPYDITVYVNTDQVKWSNINFWAWEERTKDNLCTNKNWPGDRVTTTKVVGGKTWYYKTYRIKSANYKPSFVFSTGTGSTQTVDITDLQSDTFLEILTNKQNDKHLCDDVTSNYPTGIVLPEATERNNDYHWYTIDGRRLDTRPTTPGLYIHQGRKQVVR